MLIHEKPITWYVEKLARGEPFSFAGFSDAEWLCVLSLRLGAQTALGQTISREHGWRLAEVLHERQADPRFLFAVPKCLWERDIFGDGCIDRWLANHDIIIESYERDMVLDDLAAQAGLHPLIQQLQKMRVVMIGPRPLRGCGFLGYRRFIEISSPNLHLEPDGIERAVEKTLICAKPSVYLVSAGVSAAILIHRLHDQIPDSWFIDCGSIWDGFVKVGAQRQWRAELYADTEKWYRWIHDNLYGKEQP